ncbi:type 1 glutamine amidotransferase [Algisphaera agarilytica]|uniref:GMP synthase-like glutamine amidotransferase n=1 Tax=Algisphaera agarilytica TaxID=1385975 RepID=A0A7X0H6F5_9BACT|nr:type 1 glutamine amidotransferase [Algisphaera agarilytica]MBB6430152.1 GMP synthase-like glutamine amidotransferase [Algisphaera agarilytica]
MAIVVFEHHPLETAGRLGNVLNEHGHKLRIIQLHNGDSVPFDLDDVDGVICMGGPQNTDEVDQHDWMQPELDFIKNAHDADLPVVGICLGAQLIATSLGGEVGHMDTPEIGFGEVESTFFGTTDPVLIGVPWKTTMFHAHGCEVTKAPPGGTPIPLQGSKACKCQAFKVGLNTYGFQYHFEWTRQMLDMILVDDPDFYGSGTATVDDLTLSLDQHYDTYRHLGDRICNNLATLMFPLDKRLPPSGANVDNFHAS